MSEFPVRSAIWKITRRQSLALGLASLSAALTNAFAYAKDKLFPIHFRASHVTVSDGRAVISNEDLSKAVQQDKAATLEQLRAQWNSLNADEISLDENGRVIITNAEGAAKLQEFIRSNAMMKAGQGFFDNCSCVDVGCR